MHFRGKLKEANAAPASRIPAEKTQLEPVRQRQHDNPQTQHTPASDQTKANINSPVQIAKQLLLKAHPYWLGFTGLTLTFSVIGLLRLVWFTVRLVWLVMHLVWCTITAWHIWLQLIWTVIAIGMYGLAPAVCLLGNLWLFRADLVDLAVWCMRGKKCTLKKFDITGAIDCKQRRCDLSVEGIGLRPENDSQDIVALDAIKVMAMVVKTPKQNLTGIQLEIVLEHLDVNLITYDVKFKDTNLSRLLSELTGTDVEPQEAQEQQQKPAAKEQAADKKGDSRLSVICKIKNSSIEVKAAGPLGVRNIIPAIVLDDETIDIAVLSSTMGLIKWLYGIVLRTVANSSLDLVNNAFGAAGGLATGITGKAFDGVDKVAGYVPGGSVIKGGTGAARNVIGGAVSGGGKIVGGVTGGGKHIVKGITSGSVSGMAKEFKEAGKSVGGGVVGGVTAVGSGVVDAGKSVGGGVVAAGKNAHSTISGTPSAEDRALHSEEDGGTPQVAATASADDNARKQRKSRGFFSRKKQS